MDWIAVLGILAFGCLIIGWLGYTRFTDSIIKEQEREIARLRTENKRLSAATAKVRKIGNKVVPDYKEW